MTVVEYSAPTFGQTTFGRIAKYYLAFFLIFLATFGGFCAALIFVVPKIKETFRDFNTTLPITTQWVIQASDAICQEPLVLLASLFLLVAAPVAPALIAGLPKQPGARKSLTVAMIVCYAVFGLFVLGTAVTAIVLPLVKLRASVSGGGGS